MTFRTPSFWYEPASRMPWPLRLLAPLHKLYGTVHNLRKACGKPYKSHIPVICIGNLTAGGSGKTPTALALMKLIRDHGLAQNPCFLSRGYGGRESGPLLVNPALHCFSDVGDEPLLLAQMAPVIIARHRGRGAQWAEAQGYDLIIMDDGLQNLSLQHDVKIVVVDGQSGFGNGLTIPFGPLREPVTAGLKNADAIIRIGDGPAEIPSPPVIIQAHISAKNPLPPRTHVIGFCGLGRPDKFRKTLEDLQLNTLDFFTLPDHYAYTERDLERLKEESERNHARLITTEKDKLRIPSGFAADNEVAVVPITLTFVSPETLLNIINSKIKAS